MSSNVVIVTGASSGVGAATAQACAKKGASVVIGYNRNEAGARQTAALCKSAGVDALIVQGDVSVDADCRRIANSAFEHFGRIDGLVNNAGTTVFCPMQDLEGHSSEDFMRILEVNTLGAFQMTRACAENLKKSRNASIVNVSSVAGMLGTGSSLGYAASKGALNSLTKSLARALAPVVTVNAVCPGFIQGEWAERGLGPEAFDKLKSRWEESTLLHSMIQASDVAEAIIYLLFGARHVTGTALTVDAGFTLPGEAIPQE